MTPIKNEGEIIKSRGDLIVKMRGSHQKASSSCPKKQWCKRISLMWYMTIFRSKSRCNLFWKCSSLQMQNLFAYHYHQEKISLSCEPINFLSGIAFMRRFRVSLHCKTIWVTQANFDPHFICSATHIHTRECLFQSTYRLQLTVRALIDGRIGNGSGRRSIACTCIVVF